jgi:hypothetical protein
MFQEELARLQEQKDLLVLQSEANRQRLASDWQHLASGDWWMNEAGGMMKRHPGYTAALGIAGGMFMVQALRNPGGLMGRLGRFSKLASLAVTGWKVFKNLKSSANRAEEDTCG